MKKIIAAFDGLKFSTSTIKYATYFAKKENAFLSGVFLDDKTYTSYKIYEVISDEGVSTSSLHKLKVEDELKRKKSSEDFQHQCQLENINFNIRHDKDVALKELLHETLFSDVLFINRDENFSHHQEKYPSRFLRDLLAHAACPVLILPDQYKEIEKLVFLYDGQPSSIFAMKMFIYLFPNMLKIPLEVICIKSMEDDLHLPDNSLVKLWLKSNFDKIEYFILKGIPETEVVNHLNNSNFFFLPITGAYSRSGVSRWFRTSMADVIVSHFDVPIFIAHHK